MVTVAGFSIMSALHPKADIRRRDWYVRFVPEAEVAVIRSVELIVQADAHGVVGEMQKPRVGRSKGSDPGLLLGNNS
jgi:hypothetical protein